VEEIGGFTTLMQATEFARRYVRDSLERCRAPGMDPRDVLDTWFSFGEDAHLIDAGEGAWQSATELHDFAARPARAEERDWRALDPRLDDPPDDEPPAEDGI
jgi:hypothetical protein